MPSTKSSVAECTGLNARGTCPNAIRASGGVITCSPYKTIICLHYSTSVDFGMIQDPALAVLHKVTLTLVPKTVPTSHRHCTMEPAGLTVGVVALAGLFNNAVDCFEYIQLGRNFGKDFQTSLLKLDNARLRLSRWGEAARLNGDVADVQSLELTALSPEDIPKAEGLLGHILDLFTDAEKVSGNFKSQAVTGDSGLMVLDVHADLDAAHRTLHDQMRGLSIRRQNKTSLQQKAKWALYEKKHLERLISDVIELVNDLVETFPAIQQAQRELCKIEVSDIGTNGSLPILEGITASQDKELHAAILEVLKKSDVSIHKSEYLRNLIVS
jgi:Prion-inhibition and propagation